MDEQARRDAQDLSEDARILADRLIARGIGTSVSERLALARILDAFRAVPALRG